MIFKNTKVVLAGCCCDLEKHCNSDQNQHPRIINERIRGTPKVGEIGEIGPKSTH